MVSPSGFTSLLRVAAGSAVSDAMRIIPCSISSRKDYNDFTPTPLEDDKPISAIIKKLEKNGRGLDYAVEAYPLVWPE